MGSIYALMLLAILPVDPTIEDRVDVLHRNHVYDPITGEQRVDQIGGMRWNQEDSEYHWDWWRMADKVVVPRRDYQRGCWVMSWYDEQTQTFRRVYANSFQESHTLYDEEIRDREFYPQRQRRGLTTSVPGSSGSVRLRASIVR